jgi:Zinc finger C-x8-C-x5-C-x3-H type (and similar)
MSGLSLQLVAAGSARDFEKKRMNGTVTGARYYAAWRSYNKGVMATVGAEKYITPTFTAPKSDVIQAAITKLEGRQDQQIKLEESMSQAADTIGTFNLSRDMGTTPAPTTEASSTIGDYVTKHPYSSEGSSSSRDKKYFDFQTEGPKLAGLQKQLQGHRHITTDMNKAVSRAIVEMRKTIGPAPTAVLDQVAQQYTELHLALRETLRIFDQDYSGNEDVVKKEIKADLEALVYANSPETVAILVSNLDSLRLEAVAHGMSANKAPPSYLTDDYMVSLFAERVSLNESTRKVRDYLEEKGGSSRTWRDTMTGVTDILASQHVTIDQRFAALKTEHSSAKAGHAALGAQGNQGQQKYGASPGVCYTFQKSGTCSRGGTCKFLHVAAPGTPAPASPVATIGLKRPGSPLPTASPTGSTASSPGGPVCSKFLQGKCPYAATDCPHGAHRFRSMSPYQSPQRTSARSGGSAAGGTPARR